MLRPYRLTKVVQHIPIAFNRNRIYIKNLFQPGLLLQLPKGGDEKIIFAICQFAELRGVVFIRIAGGAQFRGEGSQIHFAPTVEHQAIAIILSQRNDLCI